MKSSVRLIFALLLVSCLTSLASKAWAKGIIRDPKLASYVPTTAGMALRNPRASEVA